MCFLRGSVHCALLLTSLSLQFQSVSHFTRGSLTSGSPGSDRAEGMLQGQKKVGTQGKGRGLLSQSKEHLVLKQYKFKSSRVFKEHSPFDLTALCFPPSLSTSMLPPFPL